MLQCSRAAAMLHCNTQGSVLSTIPSGDARHERIMPMSTFDAFGEAALLAHAGQRQIARNLLAWLRRFVVFARVG